MSSQRIFLLNWYLSSCPQNPRTEVTLMYIASFPWNKRLQSIFLLLEWSRTATTCIVSSSESWLTWHVILITENQVLYSREQKHVLLFRKSKILLFKVSITNMPEYFIRNKTFLFLKIESWNFQHLIDF